MHPSCNGEVNSITECGRGQREYRGCQPMSSDSSLELSRRRLLQTGAAVTAAAAIGGCLSSGEEPDPATTPTGDEEYAYGNCWMCHHACGQELTVREGTAVDITGVDEHPRGSAGPDTPGTLCPKGQAELEKLYDPDRITEPHIRKDGELEAVDWDEAIEYTAQRLHEFDDEHGAEKMLDATSWSTTNFHGFFWGNLYGTPERIGRGRHVCFGGPHLSGDLMGLGSNMRFVDYQHSEYIIAWGRNIFESFAGQWEPKGVLEALDNGATLVVVDPQHTPTAQKADYWLPIEPRTDGALALAMGHVILEEGLYDQTFVEEETYGFEAYEEAVADKTPEWAEDITGIDADVIREVAIGFAEAAPAAGIALWTGVGQYGEAQKASQNVFALNGLVGNIDRPGGLRLWNGTPMADPFEVCEWTPDDKATSETIQGVDLPNNAEGKQKALHKYDVYNQYPFRHIEGIAHNLVPEMVENGHINGIYCHHDMPLKDGNADAWMEALDEMDLVIAVDAYWNGVSRNADVVLADATQLEKDTVGTGSWSAYSERQWVVGGKAATEPQFNTKPDWEILTGIAEAMGWGEYFPWENHEEFIDDQLSEVDLTLDELCSGEQNFELVGEYGYEQWRAQDGPAFRFDLDQVPPFVQAAEEAGMGTAPEWHPPGTYGDELSEEYPLEFYDIRSVFFSHGSDQGIDRMLDQFARKNDLADEDYRGNYLHINPADADERGIETGDMVTVESATGRGELMAHVTELIRPGFVTSEYGFGDGSAQQDYEGMNTMKLHAEQMDPITGQPDRHVAVEVRGGV